MSKWECTHMIDLELNRNLRCLKQIGILLHLNVLKKYAILPSSRASRSLANICLVTQHMIIVRQRIEYLIPRKRKGREITLLCVILQLYVKVVILNLLRTNFVNIYIC
ncbi:Protein pelota [Gigaspora margarita]|uniref:Protein pelota n=1 Tax=Gigaspora margarita TaxID=4874 RepID=A0A8H4AJC7_GIGMA|nr:Protein pelota [Gigaspora margarita]